MADRSTDDSEAVWKLLEGMGVAMFATHSGQQWDARPLAAHPDRDANCIFFMTDSPRVLDELAADPRVLLTFAGKTGSDFVAVNGKAVVTNDRERIRELWTVWSQAYWKGPDDPAIRVITVVPEHARYWDGSNPVFATVAMLKGVLTGKQPDLGKSGETGL